MHCKVCDGHLSAIDADNRFKYCNNCGTINYTRAKKTEYEDSYFFKEYREQYKRNYLEDKHILQKRMSERLQTIEDFRQPPAELLEIGSAAGFFLELALEKGYQARGWEVSKTMSTYANEHGWPTVNIDFLTMAYETIQHHPEQFDIICAFYVIEHFNEQKKVFQYLYQLLKKDGLVALALPSSYGPLFTFHFQNWALSHPSDHFVDYSPASIQKAAAIYGFKVLKIIPEALHPERFPLSENVVTAGFYRYIQTQMNFADTMFVLLQKI